MENATIYDFLYTLITTYICPAGADAEHMTEIVIYFCVALSLAIFYFCIIRPFFLWIKYGMFGSWIGKKSRTGSGRRKWFGDEDD
ncbi:MAG: hypothetical protein MJ066_05350 [Clostridia bacterium]|nr:hypothetical protein [Clostridia bacterium]